MSSTTRRRGLWTLLALLLVGCATIVTRYATAAAAMRPDLTVTLDEDSVRVRLSWSPVRDARGDAVARYVATLTDHGQVVATGETTDTTWTAALPRIAGDSLVLAGEVYAIDVRGNRGAVGMSAPVTVVVPDPGPPAPTVRLDTIPLALGGVYDSLRMYFPAGRLEDGVLYLDVGESVQGCVIAWRGGSATRPMNQPAECLQTGYAPRQAGLFRIARAVRTVQPEG